MITIDVSSWRRLVPGLTALSEWVHSDRILQVSLQVHYLGCNDEHGPEQLSELCRAVVAVLYLIDRPCQALEVALGTTSEPPSEVELHESMDMAGLGPGMPSTVQTFGTRYGLLGCRASVAVAGSRWWKSVWQANAAPGAQPCSAVPSEPDHAEAAHASGILRCIAVLGGSFNPPHRAHIAVASQPLAAGYDEVWLVPCGARPDKPSLATPAWLRTAVCCAAVEHTYPQELKVQVVPIEVPQKRAIPSGVLFTQLRTTMPGYELHMVIGADLVPTLSSWHNAAELLARVHFFVVPRPGYESVLHDLDRYAEYGVLPAYQLPALLHRMPGHVEPVLIEAASSDLRAASAEAQLHAMLPAGIEKLATALWSLGIGDSSATTSRCHA